MTRLDPPTLAKHGSAWRARICTDDCPECAPQRAWVRYRNRQRARARRRKPTDLSTEDIRVIQEHIAKGWTYNEIGRVFRLRGGALWALFKRRGLIGGSAPSPEVVRLAGDDTERDSQQDDSRPADSPVDG